MVTAQQVMGQSMAERITPDQEATAAAWVQARMAAVRDIYPELSPSQIEQVALRWCTADTAAYVAAVGPKTLDSFSPESQARLQAARAAA